MAWKYNNRVISAGRSWQDDNGITHPKNWMIWSDEDKSAAGLVWEDDPEAFDSRFYFGRNADGSLIEKNLDDVVEADDVGEEHTNEGIKTLAIKQTKLTASFKLAKTDWMVVKAAEVSDYSVPESVATYRAAVRTASNDIETAIKNAPGFNAFVALHDAPFDSEGNQTGPAPIDDWPKEI